MFRCEVANTEKYANCDSENPLEDLEWLKEKKTEIEMNSEIANAQIIRYTYKGNDVFWIDPCYQCPDALTTVYNCKGEPVCEFGGIDGRNTCPDFYNEASDSTMLLDYVQH